LLFFLKNSGDMQNQTIDLTQYEKSNIIRHINYVFAITEFYPENQFIMDYIVSRTRIDPGKIAELDISSREKDIFQLIFKSLDFAKSDKIYVFSNTSAEDMLKISNTSTENNKNCNYPNPTELINFKSNNAMRKHIIRYAVKVAEIPDYYENIISRIIDYNSNLRNFKFNCSHIFFELLYPYYKENIIIIQNVLEIMQKICGYFVFSKKDRFSTICEQKKNYYRSSYQKNKGLKSLDEADEALCSYHITFDKEKVERSKKYIYDFIHEEVHYMFEAESIALGCLDMFLDKTLNVYEAVDVFYIYRQKNKYFEFGRFTYEYPLFLLNLAFYDIIFTDLSNSQL
jgi:hypothetical protein